MSWILLAFCGPVLWAASTHIDKYLVERFFKDSGVGTLLIFTALVGVPGMPLIAAFTDVTSIGRVGIAVTSVSGLLYLAAIYFYLRALQQEEASVIAPLFQTSTLFTYIIAYFVLHETLTGWRHGWRVAGHGERRGCFLRAERQPSPDQMERRGADPRLHTILGSSMTFIDGTVVNVALPALQADLHATITDVQWVIEAYALFLGALILVGGSIGDQFGRKRVFLLGVAFFTARLGPVRHRDVARAS